MIANFGAQKLDQNWSPGTQPFVIPKEEERGDFLFRDNLTNEIDDMKNVSDNKMSF